MTQNHGNTETLYKTVQFRNIAVGSKFEHDGSSFTKFTKTTALQDAAPDFTPTAQGFKPTDYVKTEDLAAMENRAAFLAKPLFDGTEASCKTRQDFYALTGALDEVVTATEKLDEITTYVARKMADIKATLERTATRLEPKDRFSKRFSIAPKDAVVYSGLNSCGELQGNGNIDMAVATLIAKREAFASVVRALGYRLTEAQ